MTTTVAEKVAAGADWLDGQQVLWWERVDLDALEMESPYGCVLGQLFGNYYEVELPLDEAIRLGFDSGVVGPAQLGEFEALAQAWRELILGRRAEAMLSA